MTALKTKNADSDNGKSSVTATLEDQVNPYTRVTIRSEGKEETHRLVHHLQEAGFRFERMPSEEEIEKQAKDYADNMLIKHLGRKMYIALQHGNFLQRLAAKYIYNKN